MSLKIKLYGNVFSNNHIYNFNMIDYSWFNELKQPLFSPPAWLFSPVWTILYILIAISLFLFIKEKSHYSKIWGYILFFVQIALNLIWSPVFFGLKSIGLAFIIIILLDILVLFNILEFKKISKISGVLLIPYFIWILYATYLNFGFLVLN